MDKKANTCKFLKRICIRCYDWLSLHHKQQQHDHHPIPHDVLGKYGGGLVLMKPASPGTGVIAGGAMRAVMESAGIKDVLAKSKGSSNPHNVVKATFDGLMRLRDPLAVSKQRGVSINKIFNG